MSNRTTGQTLLIALGTVVLVAGLLCAVIGFVQFTQLDASSDDNSPMFLFGGGAFAAVVGLGIVGFTRSAIIQANGGYRITVEQGMGTPRGSGGRFCSGCGKPIAPSARFCESCGAAAG